jgi:hypothetical protein
MIEAKHASAPPDHLCADCTMGGEACPDCYAVYWQRKNPNTTLVRRAAPGDNSTKLIGPHAKLRWALELEVANWIVTVHNFEPSAQIELVRLEKIIAAAQAIKEATRT